MLKKSSLLLSVTLLATLASCGGGSDKSSPKKYVPQEQQTANPQMEMDADLSGQYLGVLETLNAQAVGNIRGAFTFARDLDQKIIIGDVRLAGSSPNLIHTQYVRTGLRCPTLEDDKNADGFIDAVEGEAVYGKILIPLDGDLNTQSSHDGDFPLSDTYGDYIYSKTAPFETFMKDLRSRPGRAPDSYAKLATSESLKIENKVVLIHGIDPLAYLPETVATVGRYSKAQSLPIACATITKVLDVPGTTDDGTYPGTYP